MSKIKKYINMKAMEEIKKMDNDEDDDIDNDCIICFEPISQKKTFVKCHTCFKVFHYTCFHTWICKFKKSKIIICPHCQQEGMMLYKITSRWRLPFFKKKNETSVSSLIITNNV